MPQLVMQQFMQHHLVDLIEEPLVIPVLAVEVEPDTVLKPMPLDMRQRTAVAAQTALVTPRGHRSDANNRQHKARPHERIANEQRRGRNVLAKLTVDEAVRINVGAVSSGVVCSVEHRASFLIARSRQDRGRTVY